MTASEDELACLIYNTTYERLSCLNDVKARLYLPVTVFIAILVVIGAIGNTTVCLVYWKRTSRASSHYFILSLAVLDLVTCVVGMPTEIADLVLPYTFQSPLACKILRFTHSTTIIASSTILIQVAFDRYYRICQLGRQFTANKARFLCFGAVVLGLLCSWPSCLLFGRKTVTVHIRGYILRGTDCSTDDSMRGTIYPAIYYAFLFTLFFITVAFFAVLYSKIGLTILHRKRLSVGSSSSVVPRADHPEVKKVTMPEPSSSDMSSGQEDGNGHSTASSTLSHTSHPHQVMSNMQRNIAIGACRTLALSTDSLKLPAHSGASEKKQSPRSPNKFKGFLFHFHHNHHNSNRFKAQQQKLQQQRQQQQQAQSGDEEEQHYSHSRQGSEKGSRNNSPRQIRVGKTTTVLFAVTLAYILSFLPYLIVMVMRSLIKDLEAGLSPLGELAYKFCVKSFFINNAINPLIYSFLNQSFRQDAKVMFRRLCSRSRVLR
ncbi:muscarinic acetylcholine receptor M5 [Aplysia californica]|uniref:Muscarinic acetylcholine receptor M5 n=1 Tax=Aplysia californica TaxID=6500 RepID=A0ABM0K7N2_APLCA|nr:muscarinic acetylcholine receptor M5 [Aplysia californica]